MRKSLVVCTVLGLSLFGCGEGASPPSGDVDDTGGAADDTAVASDDATPTDSGTTPATDTGTTPTTDSGTTTTPTDGAAADTSTPGTDSGGGGCPASGTQAVHVTMNVTWPGTTGTQAGSGVAHVWTRSVFTIDASNNITATNSPCGSQVPDLTKNPIAGGGKTLVEFPPAVWTSTAMPRFAVTGKQSGSGAGSTITMNATPVLVGLTMTNPTASWPALADITAVDHDGDTKDGITGVPKEGSGYTLPPTSLIQSSHADRLYIASRNTVSLSGTRESCASTKGTATVKNFDNHVIGCHVKGAGECTQAQYKFIDDNRTIYSVTSATYESVIVPDGSTCDAVRAALPPK